MGNYVFGIYDGERLFSVKYELRWWKFFLKWSLFTM
jgi:hypothetical protein